MKKQHSCRQALASALTGGGFMTVLQTDALSTREGNGLGVSIRLG